MRRPGAIVAATAVLLVSAMFTFMYGGIVPLFPGLVSQPVPLGASALAAVALVAAIGVWRGSRWGRWLGVGSGAILLARDIGFVATGQLLDAVSVALDLILLFLLLRRWPPSAEAAPVTTA